MTLPPDATGDAQLIARTRAGDMAAFDELYRRHVDDASKVARIITNNSDEAQDIVAEAFTRVLSRLREGGGPDAELTPYLRTVVRRLAIDRHRTSQRAGVQADPAMLDVMPTADDPMARATDRQLVRQAFETLPERWQQVLWHTEIEGRSPASLAQGLGSSPNAVAALAYRAREGLRQAYITTNLSVDVAPECIPFSPKIPAHLRGSLSAKDTGAVTEHLSGCVRCRERRDELMLLASDLRGVLWPALLLPVAAGAGAAAAGAGAAAGGGVLAWLSPTNWAGKGGRIMAGSAAAAVVAAVALALALSGGDADDPAAAASPSSSAPADDSGSGDGGAADPPAADPPADEQPVVLPPDRPVDPSDPDDPQNPPEPDEPEASPSERPSEPPQSPSPSPSATPTQTPTPTPTPTSTPTPTPTPTPTSTPTEEPEPPSFDVEPVGDVVVAGDTATFTVKVTGHPEPSLQWQVREPAASSSSSSEPTLAAAGSSGWTDIDGATEASFTIPEVTPEYDGRQYRVEATNDIDTRTTDPAMLTVRYAPLIIDDPEDQRVRTGRTATFTASAEANPDPAPVGWEVSDDDGASWKPAKGSVTDDREGRTTLTVRAGAGHDGDLYRAVFGNTLGTSPTDPAELTVGRPGQLRYAPRIPGLEAIPASWFCVEPDDGDAVLHGCDAASTWYAFDDGAIEHENGRCLRATLAESGTDGSVSVSGCTDSKAQKWTLPQGRTGQVRSALHAPDPVCLDIPGHNPAKPLIVWPCHEDGDPEFNQDFTFVPLGNKP